MNNDRGGLVVVTGLVIIAGLTVLLVTETRQVRQEAERIRTLAAELEDRWESPPPTAHRPASARDPSPAPATDWMQARLARLEGRLEEIRPDRSEDGLAAVEARLSHLEGRPTGHPRVAGLLSRVSHRKLTSDEVAEKQQVIRDTHESDKDRIAALRALRTQPRHSDPYSDDLVPVLLDWMQEARSPRVRANVIRNLHRGEVHHFKASLMDYLRRDPDPKVREEAADTLEHCLDDPVVCAALREAEESDPDPGVRKQAHKSLKDLDD